MKIKRGFKRGIIITVIVLIATPVITMLLLLIPSIQQRVADRAAEYISNKTGMTALTGNINIAFPYYYKINDIMIRDHHDSLMLQCGSARLSFASISIKRRSILINSIKLNDTYVNRIKHAGETTDNLSLFLSRLEGESPDDTSKKEPYHIRCHRALVDGARYRALIGDKNQHRSGIDFEQLDISGIYADLRNISNKGDVLSLRINKLNFAEQSGFNITSLSSFVDITPTSIRLRSLSLETNQSAIAVDLSFHYQSFADFSNFFDRVYMRGNFGVSTLSSYDMGFFIPELFRTNNEIRLKGYLEGFVSRFVTEDFQFSTGGSSFDGNLTMQGLPDLEKTYITLDINHLVIDPSDISRFHTNRKGVVTSILLPEALLNLGAVSVRGQFDGTYKDFYTNASFMGSFGAVEADMQLSHEGSIFSVDGFLSAKRVDGGRIIKYPDLGMVNLDATISGKGSAKNWQLQIGSLAHSVDFKGYHYENISINGTIIDRMFNGTLGIEDKNIGLNFDGILDFNGDLPAYNFAVDIRNANPANLKLVNDTMRGLLSTRMTIDVRGNHPDNLAGNVKVDFADFKTPNYNYSLNHLDISAFTTPNDNRKLIAIRSDFLDGDIHGNFDFSELEHTLQTIGNRYLPVIFPDRGDTLIRGRNDLHFDLAFKETGNLTALFTGKRIETPRLQLTGSYLSESAKLNLHGSSDKIEIDGVSARGWYLHITNAGEGLMVETGADAFLMADTALVYSPHWEGIINNNQLANTLFWKYNPDNLVTDGLIHNRITFSGFTDFSLVFLEGNILIQDTLWRIRKGSGLSFVNKSLEINNIIFYSHGQSIRIDGTSAAKSDQAIECNFREINLSWIDFLTLPYGVDMDGTINGNIAVKNLWDRPQVLANLSIDKFSYNSEDLGTLKITSLWDDELKGMKLSGDFIYRGNVGLKKSAALSGYIFPGKGLASNFDLTADLDNFRINFLSTILSAISTDIRGYATGTLHLGGPFDSPVLTGKLKANVRNMLVDYLNTWYSFADTLTFKPGAIVFDNIQLSDNNRLNSRDPYSGILHGTIKHKGFKKFILDLSIKANNFTFLNTDGSQDDMYNGRALASGNISITGPVENIMISVQAKTERNTVLEIPLSSSSSVSRSSFITFIDRTKNDDDDEFQPRVRKPESNISLDFNLQVTPDATVKLIFDPLTGDVIEGSGSGNILMKINNEGEFDLRGQYVIAKGDYLFNLENLISKRFSVKSGGTIKWSGDPYDAMVNIEAIYNTKASLVPLSIADSTSSTTNVNCIIHMTENLFHPNISFGIELPDMTSFDNEKYQAIIKPNLNYHFLSLLAISRFANTNANQFMEAGSPANIAGVNTTEILANQLSVWLSNISNEFDIDFAYHPGTGLTPEQVEAAFKTQVLNDRLTIESKVGIGGKTYGEDAGRTSNMVGDIVAEYRIDKEDRIRIKAFNRYNEQNILYYGAPYTQGVGIFYRKEFNRFSELLKRKKKKNLE